MQYHSECMSCICLWLVNLHPLAKCYRGELLRAIDLWLVADYGVYLVRKWIYYTLVTFLIGKSFIYPIICIRNNYCQCQMWDFSRVVRFECVLGSFRHRSRDVTLKCLSFWGHLGGGVSTATPPEGIMVLFDLSCNGSFQPQRGTWT